MLFRSIAIFGGDDPFNWPSSAIRYERQVRETLGPSTDSHFRMYFIEHAPHGSPFQDAPERSVFVGPAARKALEDLVAWVESETAPAPSTRYKLDTMNQLILPDSAAGRRGCQPLVHLTVGGRSGRLETGVGTELAFRAVAEDPDNQVARIEVDFEGRGKYADAKAVEGSRSAADFRHAYSSPGTYFATARVTDSSGIQNLGSIRVVVK